VQKIVWLTIWEFKQKVCFGPFKCILRRGLTVLSQFIRPLHLPLSFCPNKMNLFRPLPICHQKLACTPVSWTELKGVYLGSAPLLTEGRVYLAGIYQRKWVVLVNYRNLPNSGLGKRVDPRQWLQDTRRSVFCVLTLSFPVHSASSSSATTALKNVFAKIWTMYQSWSKTTAPITFLQRFKVMPARNRPLPP